MVTANTVLAASFCFIAELFMDRVWTPDLFRHIRVSIKDTPMGKTEKAGMRFNGSRIRYILTVISRFVIGLCMSIGLKEATWQEIQFGMYFV